MANEIALKQASGDWDISQAIASELKRPWIRMGDVTIFGTGKGLIPSKLVRLVEL